MIMLVYKVRVASDTIGSTLCCVFALILLILIAVFVTQLNQKKKKITKIEPSTTRHTDMYVVGKSQNEDDRKLVTPTNDRFIEVDPGLKVNRTGFPLPSSYETESSRFIRDAKNKHLIEGKPVPYHPFQQYWATFLSLNADQEKWYFYWRSEIRKGHFINTDASYIFIYVYELLCLIENSDPTHAAIQIRHLWEVYHLRNESLDNYLLEWAGDLLTNEMSVAHGIAWWRDLISDDVASPPDPILNVIIQQAVDAGKAEALSTNVWSRLNLYKPRNKFYQQYNKNGIIDQAYLKAIIAVDNHLSAKKNGKGLLDRYTPLKIYPQTKQSFKSAIVPESYEKKVCYGYARNFVDAPRLGNFLLAITKYAENILRKQYHFSARLSGFQLDEKIREIIDCALNEFPTKEKEKPVELSLDENRINHLRRESDQVRVLLEPIEDEEAKPNYSDIALVRALWEKLDLPSKRLLLSLHSNQILENDYINASTSVLIEEINKLSSSLLGDRIISIENESKMLIADDYKDEMDLIAIENPIQTLIDDPIVIGALSPESTWKGYFKQLSNDEVALLSNLISTGSLQESEIETFARSRGLMGNLLIDSICEKAINYLGRSPFYPEGDSWLIEEDDINVMREFNNNRGD